MPGSPSRARTISSATKTIDRRDRRFDRRRRHVDEAESGGGERDAVRDGESGDRQDELPRIRCDQDQREHEEKMIDAEQDVLDAEREVGGGDRPSALTGGNPRPRRSRRQPFDPLAAVGERHAHQRVGHGARQPFDPHLLAAERIDRRQAPGLHHGVVGYPRNDRGCALDPSRKAHIERQPCVAAHRRLEQDIEYSGRCFLKLEIGRTNLVRECGSSGEKESAHDQEEPGETHKSWSEVQRPHHWRFASARGGTSKGPMPSSTTTPYFSRSLAR